MTSEPGQEANLQRGQLERQIHLYQWAAWMLVALGTAAGIYGVRKISNLGDLGSYLQGTTGSLFALAGLLLIYVAFLGQKLQLLFQREEIENQKEQFAHEQALQKEQAAQQEKELERQRAQFPIQNESIKLQNYESSFFQLLHLHNQIVMELKYTGMDRFNPVRQKEATAR